MSAVQLAGNILQPDAAFSACFELSVGGSAAGQAPLPLNQGGGAILLHLAASRGDEVGGGTVLFARDPPAPHPIGGHTCCRTGPVASATVGNDLVGALGAYFPATRILAGPLAALAQVSDPQGSWAGHVARALAAALALHLGAGAPPAPAPAAWGVFFDDASAAAAIQAARGHAATLLRPALYEGDLPVAVICAAATLHLPNMGIQRAGAAVPSLFGGNWAASPRLHWPGVNPAGAGGAAPPAAKDFLALARWLAAHDHDPAACLDHAAALVASTLWVADARAHNAQGELRGAPTLPVLWAVANSLADSLARDPNASTAPLLAVLGRLGAHLAPNGAPPAVPANWQAGIAPPAAALPSGLLGVLPNPEYAHHLATLPVAADPLAAVGGWAAWFPNNAAGAGAVAPPNAAPAIAHAQAVLASVAAAPLPVLGARAPRELIYASGVPAFCASLAVGAEPEVPPPLHLPPLDQVVTAIFVAAACGRCAADAATTQLRLTPAARARSANEFPGWAAALRPHLTALAASVRARSAAPAEFISYAATILSSLLPAAAASGFFAGVHQAAASIPSLAPLPLASYSQPEAELADLLPLAFGPDAHHILVGKSCCSAAGVISPSFPDGLFAAAQSEGLSSAVALATLDAFAEAGGCHLAWQQTLRVRPHELDNELSHVRAVIFPRSRWPDASPFAEAASPSLAFLWSPSLPVMVTVGHVVRDSGRLRDHTYRDAFAAITRSLPPPPSNGFWPWRGRRDPLPPVVMPRQAGAVSALRASARPSTTLSQPVALAWNGCPEDLSPPDAGVSPFDLGANAVLDGPQALEALLRRAANIPAAEATATTSAPAQQANANHLPAQAHAGRMAVTAAAQLGAMAPAAGFCLAAGALPRPFSLLRRVGHGQLGPLASRGQAASAGE